MKQDEVVSEFTDAIQDHMRATGHKIHWRKRSLAFLGKSLMAKINKYIAEENMLNVERILVEIAMVCMMLRDKIRNPEAGPPGNGG